MSKAGSSLPARVLLALSLVTVTAARQDDAVVEELRELLDYVELLQSEGAAEELRQVLAEAGRMTTSIPTDTTAAVGPIARLDSLAAAANELRTQLLAREWSLAHYERQDPVDEFNVAAAQHNVAVLEKKLGYPDEALALAEDVHATFSRLLPVDDPALLVAKQNLAVIRTELGDLEGALELERDVLATRGRLLPAEHPEVLAAKLNLAGTMWALGDPEGARALFESLDAVYARIDPEHAHALATRLNLGTVRMTLGDLTGANELFESVHTAYTRSLPPGHPLLLSAKMNLSVSLKTLGEIDRAMALEEHVWRTRAELLPQGHLSVFAALHNIGVSKTERGDFAEAAELLERVVEAYDAGLPDGHPDRVGAYQSLAAALMELGERDRALALFERVRTAVAGSRPPDHVDVLVADENLALARYRIGDVDGAADAARSMLTGTLARLSGLLAASPRQASEACAGEADRVSAALFLNERGVLRTEEVFALVETRRHVASVAFGHGVVAGDESDRERAEWARLSRRLGELVVGGPAEGEDADAWRGEIARVSERRDDLLREYLTARRDAGAYVDGVEPSSVATALPEGACGVSFLRYEPRVFDEATGTLAWGPERLVALLVSDEGAVQRVDLGSARTIEELVEAWRRSVGEPLGRGTGVRVQPSDTEPEASRALARAVLDPIVKASGASRLYVCSDDVLHLVPLDALVTSDGRRAGDVYRITREVSFGLSRSPARDSDAEPVLLIVGDVDFDHESEHERVGPGLPVSRAPLDLVARGGRLDRWDRLAGTGDEADALAARFERHFDRPADVLRGAAATKDALFERAEGCRYLHIATHGWFAPERILALGDEGSSAQTHRLRRIVLGFAPMTLSGLCLAGANRGRGPGGEVPGLLTAEELASVDLRRCTLAVLSACETNVGTRRAGLGIQSLQAALHAAGARTALTSLWRVDDDLTRQLMEAFYESLWADGIGVAESLWAAKTVLRERGAPVSAWAGWVLTGARD